MILLIKIFYGILLSGSGFLIIKYRRVVKSWTGNFVWAENYIGSGGTYIVLVLLGLFLMFIGVLYPFGFIDLGKGTIDPTVNFNDTK